MSAAVERERGKKPQPTINRFIRETIRRFSEREFHADETNPYVLLDAAYDAIRQSGQHPAKTLGKLIEETRCSPSEVGNIEVILNCDYRGTWEDYCAELAGAIIREEILTVKPDIVKEEMTRIERSLPPDE